MANGAARREVRTFKTTTKELLALSDWLAGDGCTHVAMEATGVYWKPVWHILSDGDFTLVLADAANVKNVPGRKTDVKDATWLADLLAWLDPGQLHAGSANPGDAWFAAPPQTAGARAQQACPAAAEDAGGRQHQARLGHLRHRRLVRSSDDRSADRRRNRPPSFGPSADQSHAGRIGGSVARSRHPASPLLVQQIDAIGAAIDQIDQEVDADVEPFAPRLHS
jgi:hypothetical protein